MQSVIGNLLSPKEIRDNSKRVLTLKHQVVARVQTLGIQVIGSIIGTISMVNQQRVLIHLLEKVIFSGPTHIKVWVVSLEIVFHMDNGDIKQPTVPNENHNSQIGDLQFQSLELEI